MELYVLSTDDLRLWVVLSVSISPDPGKELNCSSCAGQLRSSPVSVSVTIVVIYWTTYSSRPVT